MVNDYVILVDATADMTDAARAETHVLPMKITLGDETLVYRSDWSDAQYHAFYDKLRAGAQGATSQIPPFEYEEALEDIFRTGRDVLYLCFSSGLSDTIQAAVVAGRNLAARYPDRKFQLVDLLSATYGEGMMIEDALANRARGLGIEENAQWIEARRMHYACWFTVENLLYLARGGRLPMTSAILGTTLRIMPVLHIDEMGKLEVVEKVQGRKSAIRSLIKRTLSLGEALKGRAVFICHSDAPEDARFCARLMRELTPVGEISVGPLSPVIGVHTGPGTIGVFFPSTGR